MADKFFCNNHAEKKHIFAASSVIRGVSGLCIRYGRDGKNV